MDEYFIRCQLAQHELSWRSLWLISSSEAGWLETELLNLHYWLVLIVQRRQLCEKQQTAVLSCYCTALLQHTYMYRLHSANDGWEYSSGEWVQIVEEPRGIWQGAPCLPANWVLMNHWFGMLHVPCDGWCHWCIEDAQSSGSEAGSDGCSGWTWEAVWHCWLHTEHFTHSPDVTGQSTRITSHPALHNGNNCVTGWQFTAPFDSSNSL